MNRRWTLSLVLSVAVAGATATLSHALRVHGQEPAAAPLAPLELPIRCDVGRDCFVQFYPDADPTDDIRDFRCGRTTYNRHRGTDIRVPSMDDVRRGVEVVAAAPGVVASVRDGEPDIDVGLRGREEVVKAMKAGGNLVVLRHGDAWTSLYWHLRKDSVKVRNGQQVEAGTVLGMVGLSGDTNFPHLHFELRHRNRHVDPFTGVEPQVAGRCGIGGKPLWSDNAAAALKWRDATLVAAGFSPRTPERRIMEEAAPPRQLAASAPVLAFWWELTGVDSGDRTEVRITGPDGKTVMERDRAHNHGSGFVFDFIGRKASYRSWPPGIYTATLLHRRGDRELISETRQIEVR